VARHQDDLMRVTREPTEEDGLMVEWLVRGAGPATIVARSEKGGVVRKRVDLTPQPPSL
jgi:hypothetical protein